ncbi:MAG: SRPBCC domain-containing protein [Solirubrobacterales bacterium]
MTENRTLHIERVYQAPAEAVFDTWTNQEVILHWWHVGKEWKTASAEVDLRVGGDLRVVMYDPDKDREIGGGGRYTEIERPTRLAFTWIWDNDTRGTLIEIDFAENDGATTVSFKHSGLWDEQAVSDHQSGWDQVFDNLSEISRLLAKNSKGTLAHNEIGPRDWTGADSHHLFEAARL